MPGLLYLLQEGRRRKWALSVMSGLLGDRKLLPRGLTHPRVLKGNSQRLFTWQTEKVLSGVRSGAVLWLPKPLFNREACCVNLGAGDLIDLAPHFFPARPCRSSGTEQGSAPTCQPLNGDTETPDLRKSPLTWAGLKLHSVCLLYCS